MKVFILTSKTSIFIAGHVIRTSSFYLVPIPNSNNFDVYPREVFKLSVEDAEDVKIGFAFQQEEINKNG